MMELVHTTKWMDIYQIESETKTKKYNVCVKDTLIILGQIKWFAQWRKYSFFPQASTIFEQDCLSDIIKFLDKLKLERKLEKQKIN